ncbi:hypothetical protein AB0D73_30190 [Streptomyces sp. NPDC048215]|uniref:hypothetical protein n=1 Tax=unclassified Streptomyces TaxID=2593676 RepID=UPI002E10875E
MTACAIEDKTAGVAGTAATAEPALEPADPDGPAEPVKPRVTDASDESADPVRAGAADRDADPATAAAPGLGAGPAAGVARAPGPRDPGVFRTTATVVAIAPGSADPGRLGPGSLGAGSVGLGSLGRRTPSEVPRERAGTRDEPVRAAAPTPPLPAAASSAPPVPPMPTVPPAPAPAPSVPLVRTGSPLPPAPPVAAHAAALPASPPRPVPQPLTLSADHAYAARLTTAGTAGGPAWFAERWTLDGPEPYAVPLPLDQPEEPEADVVPLADGRVLIRRRVDADRHTFSLLYPTGPGTGELLLGALDCADLALLPPSPDGASVLALLPGARSTAVWLVAGGGFGPEHVADVPGRCSGGVWLDREGRLLALDRQLPGGGPVKAVVLDLERGGEVTPLLQITPESNDRLLTADADSGLLLVRSDAPGHDRLGWGVLGSCLPVRFPECLRAADATVTPFAVQPGQMLMPESCAVALRIDGATDSWVGLWRPAGRRLHQFAAPDGWAAGSGFWTREGVLHLPYAQEGAPCAVALLEAPVDEPRRAAVSGTGASGSTPAFGMCKPVPLGQAPLTGRTAPG